MRIRISLILIFTFLFSGCGKLSGEFAFKRLHEDSYKKLDDSIEFEKNEKIKWVYVFKEVNDLHQVGIVLLKKDIIWVDIANRVETISERNKIIYGVIENLKDGLYKIILTNNNKVIDEKEFTIFTAEEEYYKYED